MVLKTDQEKNELSIKIWIKGSIEFIGNMKKFSIRH